LVPESVTLNNSERRMAVTLRYYAKCVSFYSKRRSIFEEVTENCCDKLTNCTVTGKTVLDIGCKFVLFTNMKSHRPTDFRLVSKSVTLYHLERCNDRRPLLSLW